MKSIFTLTMNPVLDKAISVDHVAPERKLRCGAPHFNPGGGGINVSRAILYASDDEDYAQAARAAAITLRDEINALRNK